MEPVNKSEMKPLTKVVSDWVKEYFKKHDIEIADDGDRATYEFTAEDKGDFSYRGYVEVYEDKSLVSVFLYPTLSISEKKRSEVSEVLARINYGLKSGRVTMNFEKGKVRFESDMWVKDGTISVAMINQAVDDGIGIMDYCLPAVVAVVHANVSPADAYANLDGDTKKSTLLETEDTQNAWGWDRLVGAVPLKNWADDIAQSIKNNASKEEWALTGRAGILINNDDNYSCEALKRVATDAGLKFVKISAADVMDMPNAAAFRSLGPSLIYLEPGRWMTKSPRDGESDEETEKITDFQIRLAETLRDFNPKRPVVFAVSVYQLEEVTEKLRQVGLFERFIAIPSRSVELLAQDFILDLGVERCDESLQTEMGKVGQLIIYNFNDSEKRALAIIALKRIHAKQNRKIGFVDLVHIATHSLTEEEQPQSKSDEDRKQIAYHEAGHAIIAILESNGQNIPDYTSIVPGASGFGGVTVESYGFLYANADKITSYEEFRRNIRVCLGGRVAEEVVYGPEKLGAGHQAIWNRQPKVLFVHSRVGVLLPQCKQRERLSQTWQ